MGRRQSTRGAQGGAPAKIRKWLALVGFLTGLFLLAALVTHRETAIEGSGLFGGRFPDATGVVGSRLVLLLLDPLGWIGVWLAPIALLVASWPSLGRRSVRPPLVRLAAFVPLLVSIMIVAAGAGASASAAGGLGVALWQGLRSLLGSVGGGVLALLLAAGLALVNVEVWDRARGRATRATARALRAAGIGLARAAAFLLSLVWTGLRIAAVWLWHAVPTALVALWNWFTESFFNRNLDVPEEVEPVARPKRSAPPEESGPPRIVIEAESRRAAALARPEREAGSAPVAAPVPAAAVDANPDAAEADEPSPNADGEEVVVRRVPEGIGGEDDFEGAVNAQKRSRKLTGAVPRALFASASGEYALPSTDLLDDVPEIGPPVPEAELVENSRILTETLRDFGVAGRVGEVHPGPVITRYEFTPGPGVRVAQILNRSDDLALKLRAIRIRIVAPIPGKACVGIEVPNHNPVTIYLRSLLESKAFVDAAGPLSIALGKDINGYPVVTELTKMPHLLIAGTTGSGKSVCVNGIITSLLLKNTPHDLRLLMIDPKMLELPMYNGIPHLLTDVVTDPKIAARSLKWLLLEMERRYRVLAARGSRNIQSYNTKFDREGAIAEGEERLPYIVVLIDELADLMMVSGNEVEEPIARLAQTARAVGIHLIVATQRPSVDVLTGVIKANFPSRIAFQVASRTDSRTILDQNGAESLLGRGDMLFLPPAHAAPTRVHGAFVSESETQHLVQFLRGQGKPRSNHSLEEALAEAEARAESDIDDPLFEDAARLVVAAGQGSASLLQRRLKVGYSRAGRLVDMLESAGVLTPSEGSKPRDVLIDAVQLEKLLAERETSAPL